jgi:hypothetical protein
VVTSLLLALLVGAAHPMHTSLAELTWDPPTRTARVAVRVYADDLAAALTQGGAASDARVSQYVRERFSLTDGAGRPLLLVPERVSRTGDAVVIRLRAAVPAGLAGVRVAHQLLHERFADQVNVVRSSDGTRTATLLFVPGDGPKRLP